MEQRIRDLERAAAAGDPEAAARLERLRYRLLRDAWRATPAAFAAKLSEGRWKRARHLDLLSRKLMEAAHGRNKRVLVSMPPGNGKTLLTSRWTPVWYLDHYPERRVALIGYNELYAVQNYGAPALEIAKDVQGKVHFRLKNKAPAAGFWETTAGGSVKTTGIGGALTGFRLELIVVDDFVKNPQDAYSETIQQTTLDWFDAVVETRLEPGGSVIVVATRWHENDLIGRLLARDGDSWEQVILPAIAKADDPLGREPGEALWPERWPLEELELKRKRNSVWVWAALYDCDPQPATGGMFKRTWFRYFRFRRPGVGHAKHLLDLEIEFTPAAESLPRRVRVRDTLRFLVVDLATGEKEEADFTVATACGLGPSGDLFILDVFREHVTGGDHLRHIKAFAQKWGAALIGIESTQFQLALVQEARKKHKLPARELHADGDKRARALLATSWLERGTIHWPQTAPWVGAWERELLTFPVAKTHDDQVDTLSYACKLVDDGTLGTALPIGVSRAPVAPPPELLGYAEQADRDELGSLRREGSTWADED